MVWYGTVRYGTVRYGTVRDGTVRYGMVWYGSSDHILLSIRLSTLPLQKQPQ
jgi:hypothetical protein